MRMSKTRNMKKEENENKCIKKSHRHDSFLEPLPQGRGQGEGKKINCRSFMISLRTKSRKAFQTLVSWRKMNHCAYSKVIFKVIHLILSNSIPFGGLFDFTLPLLILEAAYAYEYGSILILLKFPVRGENKQLSCRVGIITIPFFDDRFVCV